VKIERQWQRYCFPTVHWDWNCNGQSAYQRMVRNCTRTTCTVTWFCLLYCFPLFHNRLPHSLLYSAPDVSYVNILGSGTRQRLIILAYSVITQNIPLPGMWTNVNLFGKFKFRPGPANFSFGKKNKSHCLVLIWPGSRRPGLESRLNKLLACATI